VHALKELERLAVDDGGVGLAVALDDDDLPGGRLRYPDFVGSDDARTHEGSP
jgi:hypothetical protein